MRTICSQEIVEIRKMYFILSQKLFDEFRNERFSQPTFRYITNTTTFKIEYNYLILVELRHKFVHGIISNNFLTKSVTMYCSKWSPKNSTYFLFSIASLFLYSSYSGVTHDNQSCVILHFGFIPKHEHDVLFNNSCPSALYYSCFDAELRISISKKKEPS